MDLKGIEDGPEGLPRHNGARSSGNVASDSRPRGGRVMVRQVVGMSGEKCIYTHVLTYIYICMHIHLHIYAHVCVFTMCTHVFASGL